MGNLQERYSNALVHRGCVEVESKSRKYRTFKSPTGLLYFVGKAGAVRAGKNASSSYALSDSHKRTLL